MTKINIKTAALFAALKKIKDVIEKRPTLSILSNFMVDIENNKMSLISTDVEVTVIVPVDLDEEVENMKFLLPFDLVYKSLELATSETIILDIKKKSATVTAGNDKTDIVKLEDVEQFPKLPELKDSQELLVDKAFIQSMVNAMNIVTDNDSQPFTTVVCVDITEEGVNVVSTSGGTLYKKSFPDVKGEKSQLLLKKKVVKIFKGLESISIRHNANHVIFTHESFKVIAKRPDMNYVKYQQVLNEVGPNLSLNRQELIHACKLASLITGSTSTDISLKSKIGILVFNANSKETNASKQVEVSGEYTGECESIKILPDNLVKLLEQVDYETIDLAITEHNKAILLSSSIDSTYKGLIMPIA